MQKRYKTMKERPATERPYEKCLETGPESLSDGELLAVILRAGTRDHNVLEMAWELLEAHPTRKGLLGLCHMNREMLMQIPGIGGVKASQILCLIELSKRIAATSASEEETFSCPEDIAACYMERMRHLEKERVLLLLLDGRQRLLKELTLSEGTESGAPVSTREIFRTALQCGAARVVLMHNHPSGYCEPSREDLLLTQRIQEAGAMVGIELLDHIIIGDKCFTSLKEQGLLPGFTTEF